MLAAALGANILIALGWKLRSKNHTYAIVLQGTGLGVFFLTVFGSFRLWHLLPASVALALLVGATVLSAKTNGTKKVKALYMDFLHLEWSHFSERHGT